MATARDWLKQAKTHLLELGAGSETAGALVCAVEALAEEQAAQERRLAELEARADTHGLPPILSGKPAAAPPPVAPSACREDCVGTCALDRAHTPRLTYRESNDGHTRRDECRDWRCSDPAHRPPVAAGAAPVAPPAPAFALSDEERELVLYWSDNSDPDVERLDGTILARALARACAALGVRL